jgi:hypothetical protein
MDWDVTFWSPPITWCGHVMFNFRQGPCHYQCTLLTTPLPNTWYVWGFYNNWCKGLHHYQFCLDFCDYYRMWIFFIHCLHTGTCSFIKYLCKSPVNLLAYFVPCGWIPWDLYVFDTSSGRGVWLSVNSSQSEVFCLFSNHSLCDEEAVPCGAISVPCFDFDSERRDLYPVSPSSCQRQRKNSERIQNKKLGRFYQRRKYTLKRECVLLKKDCHLTGLAW